MPVLLAGREPHHVTGPDLFDGAVLALGPATACRHEKRLTEWMGVPCGPRTRLKRHAGDLNERRIRRLKKRVDPHCASKPV